MSQATNLYVCASTNRYPQAAGAVGHGLVAFGSGKLVALYDAAVRRHWQRETNIHRFPRMTLWTEVSSQPSPLTRALWPALLSCKIGYWLPLTTKVF